MNTMTSSGFKFDLGGRDITCLLFALAIHSTLLLWKGGMLHLPEEAGGGLGDTLVNVDFRSDVPSYEPAGGGSAPKAEGFLARVKSMMSGQGAAAKKSEDVAMGNNVAPIEVPKPAWTKTDALTNKSFADKKGFDGLAQKDALQIAKGDTQEVLVQPSKGEFKQAEANLKENKFKLAQKDVPFKIASSQSKDELVNVNAVAVNMSNKTSPAVKSLAGGPGSGAAFQSKTFAPKGQTPSGGFGGSSGGKSGGTGGGLAMGSSGGGLASGSGAGSGVVGGNGSGYGSGTGSGGGSGNGFGTGSGSGKTWGGGGGSGSGFGTGSGSQMTTLARNTVAADQPAGKKAPYNSGFNITGTLANRPIMSKAAARYEMDCRVSLRFRVDWAGKVIDGILVEVSSGSPTFDQKVIAALQQWQFSRLPANRTNEIQEGVITFVFKGV